MNNIKPDQEKFCKHCGRITVFSFSETKQRFYCTVCGNIFEE